MVKRSHFLPPNALKLVEKSLEINSYFAHLENITLAMTNDENEEIRQKAWSKILEARQQELPESVRKFKNPRKLNHNCVDYWDLIDYDSAEHKNPPVLRDIHVDETNIEYLASKPILMHDFGEFLVDMPSNTQPVERSVQLTTAAAKRTAGETNRTGFIVNTLSSRNAMPKFDSKQDFRFSKRLKHLSV